MSTRVRRSLCRTNINLLGVRDAQAFADTQLGGRHVPEQHDFVPMAVFSIPPVACVGLAKTKRAPADIAFYRSEAMRLGLTDMSVHHYNTASVLPTQTAASRIDACRPTPSTC